MALFVCARGGLLVGKVFFVSAIGCSFVGSNVTELDKTNTGREALERLSW